MDRRESALGGLRVREHTGKRGLMGDEGSHVLGMGGHQGQRGHCAAAAGEEVDRPGAERSDDRVHILGLHIRNVGDLSIAAGAPPQATRVVCDHDAVGKVGGEGAKAARIHRLADHDER